MHEPPRTIAHDQRRTSEGVGLGRVLPEPDLDTGQHVDGVGVLAVQPVEHRPPVDDHAVAALGIVDQHRQHLTAGRMGVLGVVVVRRHLFGGEGDVVAGGIELDVEDQAERRVSQRDPQRSQQLDHGARLGRRAGDHHRSVTPERLEHLATHDLVGDALVMVEALDLVAGAPQSRRPSAASASRANPAPVGWSVRGLMAAVPADPQLTIDHLDGGDDRCRWLDPRLPTALVGLANAALVALTVVAQPVGQEGGRTLGELHDDPGVGGERSRHRASRQPAADRTHLNLSEHNSHGPHLPSCRD